MTITQKQTEQGIHFTIMGSLSGTEHSTIQLFETASIAIGKKPKEIVMDLTKVIFLDSMSIGLIVGILLKCKEHGVLFRLENTNPTIKELLDHTSLIKIFPQLY
ncbi:MAG: STAS domain-containing protein [Fibrobacterota bacterium]